MTVEKGQVTGRTKVESKKKKEKKRRKMLRKLKHQEVTATTKLL